MPVIREPGLTSDDVRTRGGTKTIGAPEYALVVTNWDEPEPPTPPEPPDPCVYPGRLVAISPANGAANIFPGGLTFSWSSVGASGYVVWFNDAFQGYFTAPSWTPAALPISSTYTWRVDAMNECGMTFGDQWSFSTANRVAPYLADKAIYGSPPTGSVMPASTAINISWMDGGGALSFNVYLNGVLLGNQTGTTYALGVLAALTTYSWRIDSVNLDGVTPGDTWTFSTDTGILPPPNKAILVSPAAGGTGVLMTGATLTWSDGGSGTESYDVWFGGVFRGNQLGTTYATGAMAELTGYSWRIDAKSVWGTTTGDTWTFTTGAFPHHATTLAWAARVVANGGVAPSAAVKIAMTYFCDGLDTQGLTSLMVMVNCMVTGGIKAALTPLIQGTGSTIWTMVNGAMTDANLTAEGVQASGGQYVSTGVVPSTTFVANNRSLGMTAYNTNNASDTRYTMGTVASAGTGSFALNVAYSGSNIYADVLGVAELHASPLTNGQGFTSFSRTAANAYAYYAASSSVAFSQVHLYTADITKTPPAVAIWCFGANDGANWISGNVSAHRVSFAAVHYGLTSAQTQALYVLVQAMRTALGGGYK